MIRQQQDIVARRKYTDAVRQEYQRLQIAQPNLEAEELVHKLKVTVRVPKFRIDSTELERIAREVVGKTTISDIMLPQPKKPRYTDSSETTTGLIKDAEISWHFTHQEELVDCRLIGVETIIAKLQKRAFLISSKCGRLGMCGLATLISGERGSGKTTLVRHIVKQYTDANQTNFLEIPLAQVMACNKPAVALQNLRAFLKSALTSKPSVIFMDDLDIAFPAKSSDKSSEVAKRASAVLFNIQKIWQLIKDSDLPVWLIGTAASKFSLDGDFFKYSPFVTEEYRIPTLESKVREDILWHYLRTEGEKQLCYFAEDIDLRAVINYTSGWTAQQLTQLCGMIISEAIGDSDIETIQQHYQHAISMCDDESTDDTPVNGLRVTIDGRKPFILIQQKHLNRAIKLAIQCFAPEGFMDVPDVTMEDVGGLETAKLLVNNYVVQVIRNIDLHRSMGFEDSSGILMWGPPGCGKTHLAKAIANACQARFILVKGSELLDKYVGASEQKVKELFERANDNAPCLIFFDEFDALCPARSQDGLHEVSRRVVNSMLIELDGAQKRSGVFVIAATNEPSLIDEAIMRSGRFEHKLYIAPPDEASRRDILRVLCRGKPWKVDPEVEAKIAKETGGMTGADLKFILNGAAMRSWDKNYDRACTDELVIDYGSLNESMKLITKKNA